MDCLGQNFVIPAFTTKVKSIGSRKSQNLRWHYRISDILGVVFTLRSTICRIRIVGHAFERLPPVGAYLVSPLVVIQSLSRTGCPYSHLQFRRPLAGVRDTTVYAWHKTGR